MREGERERERERERESSCRLMGQERTRVTDTSSGSSTGFGTKLQLAQLWCMDVNSDEFTSFLQRMPWDEAWDHEVPAERAFSELGYRRYPLSHKLPSLEAAIPIPMTEVHR